MVWGSWVALIGGALAVAGQWIFADWLGLLGGVLAIVGAVGTMSE